MVALDGSINSQSAFEAAVDAMSKWEDELLLMTVVFKGGTLLYSEELGFVDPSSKYFYEVLKQIKEEAKELLQKFHSQAKMRGVRKISLFLCTANHIGEAIVAASQSERTQVLYLGSRGYGRITHMIIGSISKYVIQHSPDNLNVVIVRRKKNLNVVQKVKHESNRFPSETKTVEGFSRKDSSIYVPSKYDSHFGRGKKGNYIDIHKIS